MKYKHRIERLKARQKAWESMSPADQKATTKPGSLKK
jgi:hypothetical protein